jgi:replicative DNA helicase
MNKFENQYFNECQLLGILMKDDSYWNEKKFDENHLYNYNNREILKKMVELKKKGQPINLINLQQQGSDFLYRAGGSNNLKEIHDSVLSVYSFHSIQDIVVQFQSVETAIDFAKGFINSTSESNRVSTLREFMDKLQQIDITTGKKEKSTQEKLKERMKYHSTPRPNGLSGCHTGFTNLNKVTDGFQKSDLVVIGARPSLGKTAFALNSMWNGLMHDLNQHSTLFSCEMIEEYIIDRMIATSGGINLMKLRNPVEYFSPRNPKKTGDWDKYDYGTAMFQEFGERIAIHPDRNISDIRGKIRKQVMNYPNKKHIFYIDHLSHLQINGNYQNRNLEIEGIMNELKDICKEYKVTIVLLVQLNRENQKRQDKRPTMADIRDSGSIEQVADVIMLLHRESYYDKETTDTQFEVIIDKNRQGATGLLLFDFYKETNRIKERAN